MCIIEKTLNKTVDLLRKIAGTKNEDEETEAEIFEETPGIWRIRYGVSVVGRFDSRERARHTAEDWNFLKVQK